MEAGCGALQGTCGQEGEGKVVNRNRGQCAKSCDGLINSKWKIYTEPWLKNQGVNLNREVGDS